MAKNTKYLHLDEVQPAISKVLTLKGVSHTMQELSVGQMIENLRIAESLENKTLSLAEQIEFMVNLVQNVFPTCPRADLEGLSFSQLNAVVEFAQSSVEDVAAEGAPEGNA